MEKILDMVRADFQNLKFRKISGEQMGYRYYHSKQVLSLCKYICKQERLSLDYKILEIIALLHDTFKGEKNHARKAKEFFEKIFLEYEIEENDEYFKCITEDLENNGKK